MSDDIDAKSALRSRDTQFPRIPIADVLPGMRELTAGEALFRQGDKTFGIFRLLAGRIGLRRVTPDGSEILMHSVRPGELFAEAALFSERYHCNAIAAQQCTLLIYPKMELAHALRQDQKALWAFTAELAQRVQGLRTRLEVGRIRSAKERVLQALQLRCDASEWWQAEGSLKNFAEEIGLTHEALYRTLAALEREGRLVRQEGRIRLKLQAKA